jgi:serine protease Do
MVCSLLISSIHLVRLLAYCSLLVSPLQNGEPSAEATLVRVNIITETRDAGGAFEINGKRIENYSPTIIQDFASTGIVIDLKGDILTFLGYHWVDIQGRNPRVEITTSEGKKRIGKLVGIDQTNSVAVIRTNGKLKKTPICAGCKVKDGVTVMAPIVTELNPSQYQEAKILSVGTEAAATAPRNWIMAMNRPFPEIGQPILTTDHRVLGFITDQDPEDLRTIVYPIDEMMASAAKILRAGGDIRTGWLGVLLMDVQPEAGAGVVAIQSVEPGSPAQKAGLFAQDSLRKYNGKEIENVRHFIQLVEGTPIGSKATLEIKRQGNPISLTAMIEARKPQHNLNRLLFDLSQALGGSPIATAAAVPDADPPQLKVGLEVMELVPSLADALRIPGQTGLMVTAVVKESPAEQAGVQVGDVIVTMNGQRFPDPLSLASYFQANGVGPQLNLKILRKGAEQPVTIQVPN